MRSRSCGLHSQSEEQFLQLASASINNTGIFYDERINRKIMSNVSNTTSSACPDSKFQSPSSKKASGSGDVFSGFDYSPQIEVDQQEKEQLERMKTIPLTVVNLGVITSHPQDVLFGLSTLLSLPSPQRGQRKDVDLVIHIKDRKITKYWIFEKQSINDSNSLLQSYMKYCSQLYTIEDEFPSEGAKNRLKSILPCLF